MAEPGATRSIKVHGLRELQRDLKKYQSDLAKELRGELKDAAEPVRVEAERLALQDIRNIGPTWSGMRVGVTGRMVYVAPKRRRKGGSPRPNLAGLLMEKAMQPALDKHEGDVVNKVEDLIDHLATHYGF
jgi:hypothetical protein